MKRYPNSNALSLSENRSPLSLYVSSTRLEWPSAEMVLNKHNTCSMKKLHVTTGLRAYDSCPEMNCNPSYPVSYSLRPTRSPTCTQELGRFPSHTYPSTPSGAASNSSEPGSRTDHGPAAHAPDCQTTTRHSARQRPLASNQEARPGTSG